MAGISLMASEWEEKAPEIIAATGLLPRGGGEARRATSGKSRGRMDKNHRSAPVRGIMASAQRVWWPKLILGL